MQYEYQEYDPLVADGVTSNDSRKKKYAFGIAIIGVFAIVATVAVIQSAKQQVGVDVARMNAVRGSEDATVGTDRYRPPPQYCPKRPKCKFPKVLQKDDGECPKCVVPYKCRNIACDPFGCPSKEWELIKGRCCPSCRPCPSPSCIPGAVVKEVPGKCPTCECVKPKKCGYNEFLKKPKHACPKCSECPMQKCQAGHIRKRVRGEKCPICYKCPERDCKYHEELVTEPGQCPRCESCPRAPCDSGSEREKEPNECPTCKLCVRPDCPFWQRITYPAGVCPICESCPVFMCPPGSSAKKPDPEKCPACRCDIKKCNSPKVLRKEYGKKCPLCVCPPKPRCRGYGKVLKKGSEGCWSCVPRY